MMYYILKDRVPCGVDTLETMLSWTLMHWQECIVRKTKVDDIYKVSTVFIGIGVPDELFETRVFTGGEKTLSQCLRRCGSWETAEVQHAVIVAWLRTGGPIAAGIRDGA